MAQQTKIKWNDCKIIINQSETFMYTVMVIYPNGDTYHVNYPNTGIEMEWVNIDQAISDVMRLLKGK